jgi:hypothetical protein
VRCRHARTNAIAALHYPVPVTRSIYDISAILIHEQTAFARVSVLGIAGRVYTGGSAPGSELSGDRALFHVRVIDSNFEISKPYISSFGELNAAAA